MNRAGKLSCLIFSAALLAVSFPAAGEDQQPSASGPGQNVLVTLTISKTSGSTSSEKVVKLIGQDGAESSLLVGWRTPIPMVSAAKEDVGKPPVTSYTYQNVGVNARLTIKVLDGGRISLRGGIEVSGVREQAAPEIGQKAPLIGTFQQSLAVSVEEGKRLRIAEVPDPEGGTLTLSIEASVAR